MSKQDDNIDPDELEQEVEKQFMKIKIEERERKHEQQLMFAKAERRVRSRWGEKAESEGWDLATFEQHLRDNMSEFDKEVKEEANYLVLAEERAVKELKQKMELQRQRKRRLSL